MASVDWFAYNAPLIAEVVVATGEPSDVVLARLNLLVVGGDKWQGRTADKSLRLVKVSGLQTITNNNEN